MPQLLLLFIVGLEILQLTKVKNGWVSLLKSFLTWQWGPFIGYCLLWLLVGSLNSFPPPCKSTPEAETGCFNQHAKEVIYKSSGQVENWFALHTDLNPDDWLAFWCILKITVMTHEKETWVEKSCARQPGKITGQVFTHQNKKYPRRSLTVKQFSLTLQDYCSGQ